MDDQRTVPQPKSGMPVRTLRVDVIEGPDAGRRQLSEGETMTVGTAEGNDLVLTDPTVSRYHAELSGHRRGVRVRDLESTNGVVVGGVRVVDGIVPAGASLQLGKTRLEVTEHEDVMVELIGGDTLAGLRGSTPVMRRLMAQVSKLAKRDAAVLLRGETGTGKELIARALHDLGPRRDAPFVTVDCGALAPTLVASELFGHERGAFTGADRRHAGAFERADGGTLFLDEVGELPQSLQSTLLGVLERRRFRRLGGDRDLSVDVRLVSATHRDLRADVNTGDFRLDLYYRLAVVTLQVPSLRDRTDDIPILVEHFLRECGHQEPLSELLSERSLETLAQHHWPGNVRELRNWVEALVAMGEAPVLDDVLSAPKGSDPIAPLLEHPWKEARGTLLAEFEQRYLTRLLERARGNVSEASRIARMDRSHLTDLLRRHGLR